jgi:hypothetical protein
MKNHRDIKIIFLITTFFLNGCVIFQTELCKRAVVLDNAFIEESGLTKLAYEFINKTDKNIFLITDGVTGKIGFENGTLIIDENTDLEEKPFHEVSRVPEIKIITPRSKYNYELQYEEFDKDARKYRVEDIKKFKVIFYMFLSEYKYETYDEYLEILKNHGIKVEKNVSIKKGYRYYFKKLEEPEKPGNLIQRGTKRYDNDG